MRLLICPCVLDGALPMCRLGGRRVASRLHKQSLPLLLSLQIIISSFDAAYADEIVHATDPRAVYDSNWWLDSRQMVTDIEGAHVTLQFTGSSISVHGALENPDNDGATGLSASFAIFSGAEPRGAEVDSGEVNTPDFDALSLTRSTTLFTSSSLPIGVYTMKVVNTGVGMAINLFNISQQQPVTQLSSTAAGAQSTATAATTTSVQSPGLIHPSVNFSPNGTTTVTNIVPGPTTTVSPPATTSGGSHTTSGRTLESSTSTNTVLPSVFEAPDVPVVASSTSSHMPVKTIIYIVVGALAVLVLLVVLSLLWKHRMMKKARATIPFPTSLDGSGRLTAVGSPAETPSIDNTPTGEKSARRPANLTFLWDDLRTNSIPGFLISPTPSTSSPNIQEAQASPRSDTLLLPPSPTSPAARSTISSSTEELLSGTWPLLDESEGTRTMRTRETRTTFPSTSDTLPSYTQDGPPAYSDGTKEQL
ncbi:hypothetical protein BXZ70DRAFT_520196 [Cristinia sonorae]|uniref:Uncharacterized protein n=1 Tax=Cristinia sonorae TaxID=1940300 RepID=A0A8K0UVC2_9AGAR|nr:hypothetical protein BXZ70DRAFT_520196 [Cristinia sonorae]